MRAIVIDSPRVGRWVSERIKADWVDGCGVGIGLEDAPGHLIAGVLYEQYNGRSVCMHVAAEGKRWLTRDYLRFCFGYPFNQLKVNKIIGLVDSKNHEAIRFDEHLGFKLEHRIEGAGRVGDLLVYTMKRECCRYLGI